MNRRASDLAPDPAVLALDSIRTSDRRRQYVTIAALLLLAFVVWRSTVRAEHASEAVTKIADSQRLESLVDCREVDYERAQGALVSALVDRSVPRDALAELAADYARASARLEEPVTPAEEAACVEIYGSLLRTEGTPP